MTIQLGVAPIAWSNDDLPELGGDTPLRTCLGEARAAGYRGIEAGGKFPGEPEILGSLLEKYGLRLASGWFSGALRHGSVADEKRRVADQLHLFKALRCPVMVYADTTGTVQNRLAVPLSQRPRFADDEFAGFCRRLTEFADWMAGEGMPIAYHPHMGTLIETEDELDRLMEATGTAVGLALDTGHLAFAGGDLTRVVRRHGHRIIHVHCKDLRADIAARVRRDDRSFLDAVLAGAFTVPGDGCIDFRRFLGELNLTGYSGWLIVEAEQDPAVANPLQYSRLGFDHLSAILRELVWKVSDDA